MGVWLVSRVPPVWFMQLAAYFCFNTFVINNTVRHCEYILHILKNESVLKGFFKQ